MRRTFGSYIRKTREQRRLQSSEFSIRKVALRIEVEPSYLSKVERDEVAPPSEATILRLAETLGEDPDLLLAMAGKVSSDLRAVILKRPKLFAELIRQLKDAPDHAVLRITREVRDGRW
jgi:transcriptional regulator with XRE-family HTH domain